ncbi:MAG: hypothetical protein K2M20_07935 [Lachnospiraceae bacterium]|nr:hypothetical protein [Lachnospiraceae bacterium]MDE7359703.1 hypothetical protein [Lachnospiraceae bacterium]
MTHEEKKTAKIVEELTMFFFALEAAYIDTRIERKNNNVTIRLEADFNPSYADRLSQLDHYLNGQKNDGMGDIYWELAGSGDPGESSQLLLIGMMIDRAEIELCTDRVRLTLYRQL